MSLLDIIGLSKDFGGIRAVDNVGFSVAPGSIHSVIGPNGAGKTTLFNLITGVYAPSEGSVRLAGTDITARPPHELARLGISRTFQNLQIFFNMSAIENVMVGCHLHADTAFLPTLMRGRRIRRSNAATRKRAAELMHYVGLGNYLDAEADSLPYGGLKRLEIARALAAEPKLLLLDEPAAGCNPRETQEIDALIKRVADSGITILLVEHDMRLVMGISDHIVVLDYGAKLAEGTADQVRQNPDVVAAYLGAQAAED